MNHNYYRRNFGNDPSFIRRFLNHILHPGQKAYRRRDDCPAWVKEEAISKAAEKRSVRARKRLEQARCGAMQILVVKKRKARKSK